MNVLFVSPEIAPFARSGGLGEICASLPLALTKLGVKVDVVLPFYRCVKEGGFSFKQVVKDITLSLGWRHLKTNVYQTRLNRKSAAFFIECDELFDRSFLYGPDKGYFDNGERFIFFTKAVLAFAEVFKEKWDIFHCHDWQSALLPVFLKTGSSFYPNLASSKTILTIHNLGYQGIFPKELFPLTNLPRALFSIDGLEFFGGINFLKGGIIFSDFLTTVSPRYAKEIQTPEYGFGLDGVLRDHAYKLKGILNGINYKEWNPETDPYIISHYSTTDLKGKELCKNDLLKTCGLPFDLMKKPLLGMVSRLVEQKGIDILLPIIKKIIKKGIGLVILGQGEKIYEEALRNIHSFFPKQMVLRLSFDNPLAHKIIAGSDMFLMPSRYEACGLTQMYSLKYGTLPIVHHTGGLADTVEEADLDEGKGSGFKFFSYTSASFLKAIKRALFCFEEKKDIWTKLMRQAMTCDFSWQKSAQSYLDLYNKIMT